MEVRDRVGALLLVLEADERELPEDTVLGVLELNVGDDAALGEDLAQSGLGDLNGGRR